MTDNQSSSLQQPEIAQHPIEVFIEEIKNPMRKLQTLRNIDLFALTLGPQQTKTLLLPLLSSLLFSEPLEGKLAILEALPTLIPCLGHPFYSYLILETVLQILCAIQEPQQLREQTFTTLRKILDYIDLRKAEKTLLNTIQKLHEIKEVVRIKQIVIRLVPILYIGMSTETQEMLLQILQTYVNDEKEEVRLIVAAEVKQFVQIMPPVPEEFVKNLVAHLLRDPCQKVRAKMVECLVLLRRALDEESTCMYLQTLCQDTNAKVQCEIIQRCESLANVFEQSSLMNFYSQIAGFQEKEQELKNKILSKLPVLLKICPTDLKNKYLIPLMTNPPNSLQLRNTLVQALATIGDESALGNLLLLGDNQFKLKHIQKVPDFAKHYQMINGLLRHKSWRVRHNLLEMIQQKLRSSKQPESYACFLDQVLGMLEDKTAAIRSCAAKLAVILFRAAQPTVEEVQLQLKTHLQSSNWFVRKEALVIIESLLFAGTDETKYAQLWQLCLQKIEDRVGAIRAQVAKIGISLYFATGSQRYLEQIERLRNDEQEIVTEEFRLLDRV